MSVRFNPIGPPFELQATTFTPNAISLTGNTGGAQIATAFTINGGSGGATFDWDGAKFVINNIKGGFSWIPVAGMAQGLLPGNGYITTNGMLTTLTLPVTSAIGDTFRIINAGGGGIRISQNAMQGILIGNANTSIGAGGFVTSSGVTQNYSAIDLVCVAIAPNFIYIGTSTVGIFGLT